MLQDAVLPRDSHCAGISKSIRAQSPHRKKSVACVAGLPHSNNSKQHQQRQRQSICEKSGFYLFRFIEAFLENILISKPVKPDSSIA